MICSMVGKVRLHHCMQHEGTWMRTLAVHTCRDWAKTKCKRTKRYGMLQRVARQLQYALLESMFMGIGQIMHARGQRGMGCLQAPGTSAMMGAQQDF
eukprot:1158699-Pelagomonas_calceolata.AAC.8